MSRLFTRPDCNDCTDAHGRAGNDPPCDTCTPPLLPENRETARIYFKVCNQVIVAPMGGVIDINVQAVDTVIGRSDVADPDKVFHQVIDLARHIIKEISKDNA